MDRRNECSRAGNWKGFTSLLGVAVMLATMSLAPRAYAEAAFDLVGPQVDVKVERGTATLPISEVPELQAGDRLWIHPDLPDDQSAHYLMIIAFLRGATNPPPESWFTRVETWTKPVREEGVFVVVPEEAQEAMIFLAPDTGGAFSTVRNAVRAKPGAFVRAAQDLQQASFDRARLEKYLASVRETSADNPDELRARTTLLARSLNIRLDQQCFDKPSAQQAPCLVHNTDQLVLDDMHTESMVATLTTGAPADLINQISSTTRGGGAVYGPYVGTVLDLARILGKTYTAQYQYIPALSLPDREELNLRLNNPPSFRNPKSVLVAALPLIAPTPAPPLRAIDPQQILCLQKPGLVLAVEGAPLVFASPLAHDLALRFRTRSGRMVDLPVTPKAELGGLLVETKPTETSDVDPEVTGVLHGYWGFRKFDGPHFKFRSSKAGKWVVASNDASALIVGRKDTLHLQSPAACCVSQVSISDAQGRSLPATWKMLDANQLEVVASVEDATPEWVTVSIDKFGSREADAIPLHTYFEAGKLNSFSFHADDSQGILRGTRLDQVTGLEIGGVHFIPETLSRASQEDELKLSIKTTETATAKTGQELVAHIGLKDGRVLDLATTVQPPRPKVVLLSKSVQLDLNNNPPIFRLGSEDEVPQEGRLSFFFKTQVPETFSPGEKIEVATADESFRVLLSVADGNLTLQDSKTVLAVLEPIRHLGPSAFGPLKFRATSANGVNGDWQPLANLVRLPSLRTIHCVSEPERQCSVTGDRLFLIDAISTDPDFATFVSVPDGFVGSSLNIPPYNGKLLYVKLRDDPATVDTAVIPPLAAAQ